MEIKKIISLALMLFVMASVRVPLLPAIEVGNHPGWPEFHGPGRTNISPDKGLLKEWPEGGPPKLWTYSKCGKGYSGVAIAQGMIFTASKFGPWTSSPNSRRSTASGLSPRM